MHLSFLGSKYFKVVPYNVFTPELRGGGGGGGHRSFMRKWTLSSGFNDILLTTNWWQWVSIVEGA